MPVIESQDINNDAVFASSPITRRKVSDIFSRDEIQQLTRRSNLWGSWAIVSTWMVIAGTFAMIGWGLQQPVLIAIPAVTAGMILLGGRQLALAILTHEATHKTLFASKWANDWLTDWLCARPIWLDLKKYRAHHFIHHTKTGTPEDTDISLVAGLPTTRRSLLRKFSRDLLGITGVKFVIGRVLMDAGILKWTVASDLQRLPQQGRPWWHPPVLFLRTSAPTLLTNLMLYALLAAAGHGELYLAWLVAYLIPYPLFIRIRALAEHAGTEPGTDMFRNTRTTRAGWLARACVAPAHVNFHIEHHVMASVPYYRLPAMHSLLRQRGIVSEPPGYWHVLDLVSSVPAESAQG